MSRRSVNALGALPAGLRRICDTDGMGRHSAPDEDGGSAGPGVAVVDVATLLGRHSGSTGPIRTGSAPTGHAAVDEAAPVEVAPAEPVDATGPAEVEDPRPGPPARREPREQVGLELIEDALAGMPETPATPETPAPPEPAPSPAAVAPAPPTRATRASASDLALVRARGDVRARCLAGLVVPFVIYVVVLVLGGSLTLTTFLLWIWIPLISAGVLIGLFLDAGHKRYPGGPAPEAPTDGVNESPDRP